MVGVAQCFDAIAVRSATSIARSQQRFHSSIGRTALFFGERLRKMQPAASPPVTLTYGSSLVWDRVKPGTTRGSIAYLGNFRQLDECKQKCLGHATPTTFRT